MKPKKRYYWLISRENLVPADSIMDMLRYDCATVEGNPIEGYWMLSSVNQPTTARWASFGIRIIEPVSNPLAFLPTARDFNLARTNLDFYGEAMRFATNRAKESK